MARRTTDTTTNILEGAIEAFRKNAPFRVALEAVRNRPDYGVELRPHMEATVRIGEGRFRYCVVIRPTVTPADRMLLLMHKPNLPLPLLLAARHIPDAAATELMREGIEFLDGAGNAFIHQPPLYIFVKGNRAARVGARAQANRAFTGAGLKIIFALLCNPDLENRPLREIALAATAALGTVAGTMKDLQDGGFLIHRGDRGRRLVQKGALLQRWVAAWPERLRPKLLLGRYRAPGPDWWRKDTLAGKWGGEAAAAKLTGYLKPATVTVYTEARRLDQLLRQERLVQDPDGDVEVLDLFWKDGKGAEKNALVHPILVYADLMATGNQRNLEAAKVLYDRHIVQCIGED